MSRVVMLHYITGGRGDNTEWPHAGGVLDCGETEARELVAGGNARWHTEPPQTAVQAPEPVPAPVEPPEPVNGSEDDTAGSDGRPRVRDPKEAWETYAVQVCGADAAAVASMTKSDLIGQYGSG